MEQTIEAVEQEIKAKRFPKHLRQYAKRYAGMSEIDIRQVHAQCGEGKRVGERKDKGVKDGSTESN